MFPAVSATVIGKKYLIFVRDLKMLDVMSEKSCAVILGMHILLMGRLYLAWNVYPCEGTKLEH
jgi:hypothetical protein